MIKIENTEVVGFEPAIRGMRNPMNSWDKSDSGYLGDPFNEGRSDGVQFHLGANDLDLAKRLVKGGTDHSKYLRMIVVYCDITAPRYWWTEFDTYKVGTVRNSCSTMHKIHAKEFTLNDFSCEHLAGRWCVNLARTINELNDARERYLETKDKEWWWQMIQLLPQSYNQKSTVMLNYQVLRNMYHSRKGHKLDEWHQFCDWVKTLPYANELIIGEEK